MISDPARRASYRSEFGEKKLAKQYDACEYGPRSWSTLLWALEQQTLTTLLNRRDFVPRRDRYLDFACGTGRVTQFIAPHFHSTVGVDISDAMLDQARPRVPSAEFLQGDVIADASLAGGNFDLVTSFRFVLNADPSDRLPALKWLRSQLRNSSSRAIINNHANLWTHKAITHGLRKVKNRSRLVTGNVLSHQQMVSLVQDAGFSVESVHGMGHLGGQSLRLVPFETMWRLQSRLRETPVLEKLGEDQLYVLAPQ